MGEAHKSSILAKTIKSLVRGGGVMSNHGKKHNNQFKENENSGEHRNGRKSPYKNSNSKGGGAPNEYVTDKE